MIKKTSRYYKWQGEIRNKTNDKCLFCNKDGEIESLSCHHLKEKKKFPELIYDFKNGISLCSECHLLLHKIIREIEKNKKHINFPISNPKRDKKIFELYMKKHLSYRALGRIFHLSSTRIKQIVDKRIVKT